MNGRCRLRHVIVMLLRKKSHRRITVNRELLYSSTTLEKWWEFSSTRFKPLPSSTVLLFIKFNKGTYKFSRSLHFAGIWSATFIFPRVRVGTVLASVNTNSRYILGAQLSQCCSVSYQVSYENKVRQNIVNEIKFWIDVGWQEAPWETKWSRLVLHKVRGYQSSVKFSIQNYYLGTQDMIFKWKQ